jgi:uncharacterized membrane protein
LPALAWISRRIPGRSLQILSAIIATITLVRLVFNINVLEYPVGDSPMVSWVVYGYGIPAVSFFAASRLLRRNDAPHLVMLMEAGALVFLGLLISLQIRLFVAGSLDAPEYLLLEQSLQSTSWLSLATLLLSTHIRRGGAVEYYGGLVFALLATAQIVVLQLFVSNPIATQDPVGTYRLINVLLFAYAVPAAFMFRFASVAERNETAKVWSLPAAILGFVLVFTYLSLEVRHAFHGPVLYTTHQSTTEFYTYSVAWLLYAMALLGLGIYSGRKLLRYASIAVLVITVLKVFIFDMDGLTGLFRVASFLGLGLSLVGIGYIYQRFVFRPPSAAVASR